MTNEEYMERHNMPKAEYLKLGKVRRFWFHVRPVVIESAKVLPKLALYLFFAWAATQYVKFVVREAVRDEISRTTVVVNVCPHNER